MMESEAETDVVITNDQGKILYFSENILPFDKKIIKNANKNISYDGMIVQKNLAKRVAYFVSKPNSD